MAPRKCCCVTSCDLGSDDFNRADSSDPGPKWKIISGTGSIVSNHIEVAGVVATTICHPATSTNGSWIATFTLVNMRTVSVFEVGVGDPNSSSYYVKFEPINMDLISARVRITVVGTTTETFEQTWLTDIGGLSANTMEAQICYEPGALLKGSLLIPPSVDTCIPATGAPCYTSGSDDVGGFFWKQGHFDDWTYKETMIDRFECDPCGCFCFRRSGSAKEFSCYPKVLYLNLTLISGTCSELDGLSIAMTQGNLSPTDNYPQKIRWLSPELVCAGNYYAFVLECDSVVKSGTNWLYALRCRLTDRFYVNSSVLFNWVDSTIDSTSRDPDFSESTCDPLSLVYPDLKVNSFLGSCPPPAPPGANGHYIFCCPSAGCSGSPLDVRFKVTVTI